MPGEIRSLRDQSTQGHGRVDPSNSSWMTRFATLITGVSAGATGPTSADLITGAIGVTGQESPVYSVLHVWCRMRLAADPTKEAPIGSTAKLAVWVRPPSGAANDFFYVTTLSVSKPGGQLFSLSVLPPGEYRLGLAEITAGAAVDISYQISQ